MSTLIVLALLGALTCDANADGRVTIDELVAGVAAAMASPPDCHTGCAGCAPDTCYEFPTGFVNGVCTRGLVEMCWDRIDECLTEFCAAHPDNCVQLPLCLEQP